MRLPIQSILVFLGMGLLLTYQNCAKSNFSGVSNAENSALSTPAFNANAAVAGVIAGDGYPSENLRVSTPDQALQNLVQDCTDVPNYQNSGLKRSDYERAQALNAAQNDFTQSLIPVQFAVSFGTTNDTIAVWAHQRAILSDNGTSNSPIPPTVSYIPVGDKGGSGLTVNGKSIGAYYQVSHADALNDYRWGKNCFYDVVQIQGSLNSNSTGSWSKLSDTGEAVYPFISKAIPHSWTVSSINTNILHVLHYMYYGYCAIGAACNQATAATSAYGAGDYGDDVYPNRLFGTWPHQEVDAFHLAQDGGLPTPQIVKLYVADLRESQFNLPSTVIPKTNLNRGQETSENLKTLIGVGALKTIWQNREQAIINLSSNMFANDPDTKAPLTFAGMLGIPQLLSNLTLDGGDGTVLAAQYTPIVLDLGATGVLTSSAFGGTYFNMAAASDPTIAGLASYDQPHETAWLGGALVDAGAQGTYAHDFRRIADDGFLVIPDSDGQVRSSRNLFGNEMLVNGNRYDNGFLALQALAQKDCTSSDITKTYFGPWDGNLYSTTIQVWVDKNRNGKVDAGELMSLHDAGVVAISACNVVNKQETDSFGNGTSLRAAFLYQDLTVEDITQNEPEILLRLATGTSSDGVIANFHLAIDLNFQTVTSTNFFTAGAVIPTESGSLASLQSNSSSQVARAPTLISSSH